MAIIKFQFWQIRPHPTVQSNVTRMFRGLIERLFPKGHILHKIINKNSCKLSYSTTSNVSQIIAGHNKKLLRPVGDGQDKGCNCRGGPINCPVEGACLSKEVVYEATVEVAGEPTMSYVGAAATTFKERYRNHKRSLNDPSQRHTTTLAHYFWKKKDEGRNPRVSFSIKRKASAYTAATGKCHLCLAEKVAIVTAKPDQSLNKRSEILGFCRHKKRWSLASCGGVT